MFVILFNSISCPKRQKMLKVSLFLVLLALSAALSQWNQQRHLAVPISCQLWNSVPLLPPAGWLGHLVAAVMS